MAEGLAFVPSRGLYLCQPVVDQSQCSTPLPPFLSILKRHPTVDHPTKPTSRWTFDFLDLVLLGFVKAAVAKDLGITQRDEAWMLGVSLGTSGFGASFGKGARLVRVVLARMTGRRVSSHWPP